MRSTVVVNGVTLTRAQVEQAMCELDTPELPQVDLGRLEFDRLPAVFSYKSAMAAGVPSIGLLAIRNRGEFENRSFYLGDSDWTITVDREGCYVLLPPEIAKGLRK